jgi:hypothetical protein
LSYARVDHVCSGEDLFGEGRTDNAEFGLRVHIASILAYAIIYV